jgi:hypothetical protein
MGGPYNYAFTTSTTYSAGTLATHGMSGIAFADAECNRLAATNNLFANQHFVAWISDSTTDAKSRLGTANGWVRPDNRPVAVSLDALLVGKMLNPLRLDEAGRDLVADHMVFVATGTNRDGTLSSGYTASDWKDASATGYYIAGDAMTTATLWTGGGIFPVVGYNAHLYCFAIDLDRPVEVAKETGRHAFLSAGSFVPSGLAAADSACQGEATTIGLAGTYRALLSTSGAAAASRFDLAGAPWVRLDGAPWVNAASDLVNGEPLTALNVTSALFYQWTQDQVWTGGNSPSDTLGANCANFTSTSGNAIVGGAVYSNAYFFNHLNNPAPCNSAYVHLYCLEQ